MCGRFTLRSSGEAVAEAFALPEVPDLLPRFIIASVSRRIGEENHARAKRALGGGGARPSPKTLLTQRYRKRFHLGHRNCPSLLPLDVTLPHQAQHQGDGCLVVGAMIFLSPADSGDYTRADA
jgi:hypothetical protein